MVVGEASIHNIMGGMTSTGGVRLHNHKRKLKQRFDIIKKLGQGTYGKVQLGINKETGQEVAIKTIKKCKIETEADLIRIRREIQIMSSVQHPNIIHIYEVFENREKMVLVMEYAAGGELYDYLSERKVLTEQEARRIFRQIATAVFYCHKHKICHRDLKLENILLDQVGNAKIADFGLSNVFDEQRLLNTFCGSPLYASPEIVKGTPYHGPEVDCWSLGVLLYTLVYGAMPFDGSNFKRLVKQISQSDYFEPKKPSPASPLIKDMLTVSPSRRADIERICTHWWVNEGYEQNCLDIAEELAAQTPVRLDLLLSLVPQSASAEKLVVGDRQAAGDVANDASSETLVPTRCHSVGSLMELDRDNSDRRIRELLDEEPRVSPAGGDAKRKLETTPSMDETAAAGAKRKEKRDERDSRAYKSASRHHSAPIPNSITEEPMEVDPVVIVPTGDLVDLDGKDSGTAACLELIKECSERSPSKERSKTPVILEQEQPPPDASVQTPSKNHEGDERRSTTFDDDDASLSQDRAVAPASLCASGTSNEAVAAKDGPVNATSAGRDAIDLEETRREFKKLKEKALSLDSEPSTGQPRDVPAKTVERRRSKIFETAEKFNQMASSVENEKPKKIFIPGVNVGGAKRVFERKASLSSVTTPPPAKPIASKVIIDVSPTPLETKRTDVPSAESRQAVRNVEGRPVDEKEEAKRRAVDVITGAIGKPPVQKRINGSPPVSPSSQEPKKLPLKIPVGTNDSRTATVSVSTPVETATVAVASSEAFPEEPKMSSKMEITLKSATLPRPRKTSKAEISLSGVQSPGREVPAAFKSEVEAKIDAFHPRRLRTQRSEVAFPVAAAVPRNDRCSSLEPESGPKERIIPIQVEADHRRSQHSATPPPSKPPPMSQRSLSQRSGSLSRQSTVDSDTDSALGSTVGPEPIRKSPREYIIPIAVEGGGYVTPRSGSVEPECKATGAPTTAGVSRSRFGRPRRMSSLLSDASEDESPFSSLHRDSEDLLQRHMHRLRSSRPSRQPPEHADSLSSGEDDDDDGFELLTAENLFSTLLSRVRSLTQRLNVDDDRTAGFPSSRLFGRLGSNASQAFWGTNKPLSRRLSESPFKHSSSLGREGDAFSRKDSVDSRSNPGTPNSQGSRGASSRETMFDIGSSNTLPRDKVAREDVEAEPTRVGKDAQESLEQSFTPSLARRLSRTLIEQTRRSLTRSPSASYDGRDASVSTASDRTEYKERGVGSPRRSVGLFDDESRWYKDTSVGRPSATTGKLKRDSFRSYRTDKIREEAPDDAYADVGSENTADNGSVSEHTSLSICDSNTNLFDATSSLSTKSYETSPTESSSNIGDYKAAYKSDSSRNFEDRLLAAENLIKESKLRNLGNSNSNSSSSYRDTDTEAGSGSKRRSCIPGLRLRSGSLTREPIAIGNRRKSIADGLAGRAFGPEKSLLSKLFKSSGTRETDPKDKEEKEKEKAQKSKQRRISRFLRPDFFDTPREESRYVKEKEAQKAAENERRKSRFIRRKAASAASAATAATAASPDESVERERKREKELKNEINSLRRERRSQEEGEEGEEERRGGKTNSNSSEQSSRNGFLHSLEKKLERLRSTDGQSEKTTTIGGESAAANGTIGTDVSRERSAPPVDRHPANEAAIVKRAVSVEDLSPAKKSGQNSSRSRVSSVLGLFRNAEVKNLANGSRSRTAVPSKPKRSPTKAAKPGDTVNVEDATTSGCGSKIPTKHLDPDSKPTKKLGNSESPKRSPAKDGPPSTKEKSASVEKESREKPLDRNEENESTARAKKTGRSSVENGSPTEPAKPEDSNRKARKPIKKTAASLESNDADGSKKKRIVRAVKKVAKRSVDGDGDGDGNGASGVGEANGTASEGKEKSTKTRATRKKSETGATPARNGKAKENGLETRVKLGEEARNAQPSRLLESRRANRSNLKLDLSKIPQHSFRNSTPRKDSPKSDSPKSVANDRALLEPLRAKDVAELKKEVTECARIIEIALAPENDPPAEEGTTMPEQRPTSEATAATGSAENRRASRVPKESPIDRATEPLTPIDEPESFDSWSISSAELSHARPDPRSPTSPSRSLFAKTDDSESVIDRIRRRSFYTRFNDRRRPSLTAPPPGVTLPSSATLPRKFSFAGQQHRDSRDRGKYGAGCGLATGAKTADRFYGSYGDDGVATVVGARTERVPGLSCSYDPLRRYLGSPTFDPSSSRSRYHSVDFATDPDLAGCYGTHLTGSANDGPCFSASSLPRRYGTGVPEPKTVEYYEELLAPSCTDYLPRRRSPASHEYPNKSENGRYNGNSEPRSNGAKRKPYAESPTMLSEKATGVCGDESTKQKRVEDDPTSDAEPSPTTSAKATTGRAGDCR